MAVSGKSPSGKSPGAAAKGKPRSVPRRNGDLDEGLLESFPASDPPAAVDPTTHLGGGHPPARGRSGPASSPAAKAAPKTAPKPASRPAPRPRGGKAG
jgi:hypothetical protein